MQIFGIGVDIAYIPRFRRTFERYGERFLKRAYHPNEIREFQNKSARSRVLFLASRWAVKEAVFKAFQHHRISFPEIVVVSSSKDKHQCAPQLKFCGNLRSLAQSLNIVEPKISISHDQEYAIAYVILQQQSKAG
uniref:Uncharacterized protein AlNc14C21G2186 n=1 Tax=Albugo laibachii Nc14 TaxID=890382 RepID=F0W5M1_9STRA|nr:conserved hypothetical protein [Albugo laibachii Nc14]|eukprot:CCA16412.1 conserved hypothetical protein [Albugo laibachii Nc14]